MPAVVETIGIATAAAAAGVLLGKLISRRRGLTLRTLAGSAAGTVTVYRRWPGRSHGSRSGTQRGRLGYVLAHGRAGSARGYRPRWVCSGPGLEATSGRGGRLRPRPRTQEPG